VSLPKNHIAFEYQIPKGLMAIPSLNHGRQLWDGQRQRSAKPIHSPPIYGIAGEAALNTATQ
jgi:hypothetical protein